MSVSETLALGARLRTAGVLSSRLLSISVQQRLPPQPSPMPPPPPTATATARRVLTFPNALCVARICATPLVAYSIVDGNYRIALGIAALAGVTDALDGLIARRFPSQRSALGSVLDPLADKMLVSTLFLSLAYNGIIPVWLTSLVLARDSMLVAGGLLRRYQLLEPPVTVRRFVDPTISALRVKPTWMSKFNTHLQLVYAMTALASPLLELPPTMMTGLCYATAVTTIWSGAQYAWRPGSFIKRAKVRVNKAARKDEGGGPASPTNAR